MALFRQQTAVLEELTDIYRVMSDKLPTYCKTLSVLRYSPSSCVHM
jgi:hypothetical protein